MKPAKPTRILALSFLVVLFFTVQTSPLDQFLRILPLNTSFVSPPITGGQLSDVSRQFVKRGVYQAARAIHPVATPAALPSFDLEPDFRSFIEGVVDGSSASLRGVYVEDVLELPIIQQPSDDPTFVSPDLGVVTQFQSASSFGVTGLLAHNYLSGKDFYNLETEDEIRLIYGDGSFRRYKIESIAQFQKLTPNSLHSDFVDLVTGETLTTENIFARFYHGDQRLTLQTCLERNGVSNWGLTFWVAREIP